VVCGFEVTMENRCPRTALKNVDLPALGRPMIAA